MSKRKYLLLEMTVAAVLLLILTVMSIPRFTGSQIRSKIALAFQRMSVINQANHAYKLDHGTFIHHYSKWNRLTSPVVYLEEWSNTLDPFTHEITITNGKNFILDSFFIIPLSPDNKKGYQPISFHYHNIMSGSAEYLLFSNGPGIVESKLQLNISGKDAYFNGGYHTSNGLVSQGKLVATDAKVFDDF